MWRLTLQIVRTAHIFERFQIMFSVKGTSEMIINQFQLYLISYASVQCTLESFLALTSKK